MASGSLPLLRLFGIRVGVNYSWFLILFVVIFVLWDSLSRTLDASDTTVYVVAVVAALSFFGSILLHELGHLMGLAHVDDSAQLMFPEARREVPDFAAGDLTGLAALGGGVCVPEL